MPSSGFDALWTKPVLELRTRPLITVRSDLRSQIQAEDGFESLWAKPVLEFLTKTFDSGFTWDQIMRGIDL